DPLAKTSNTSSAASSVVSERPSMRLSTAERRSLCIGPSSSRGRGAPDARRVPSRAAPSLSHNAVSDKAVVSYASRPGSGPGLARLASGKRSNTGTNEYGGHGPVGTTAIPAARDAMGAIRVRKASISDRETRKATDPATLLPPAGDR